MRVSNHSSYVRHSRVIVHSIVRTFSRSSNHHDHHQHSLRERQLRLLPEISYHRPGRRNAKRRRHGVNNTTGLFTRSKKEYNCLYDQKISSFLWTFFATVIRVWRELIYPSTREGHLARSIEDHYSIGVARESFCCSWSPLGFSHQGAGK